jgi:C-terminal processing protease CtpA/Prc
MKNGKKYLVLFTLIIFVFTNVYAFQQKEEKKIIIKKKGTGCWLGVQIEDIDSKLAAKYGLKTENGVIITKVEKESPAEEAGLKVNDIILEYNGKELSETNDLIDNVQKSKKGDKVKLLIIRDENKKSITATIRERPKDKENAFTFNSNLQKGFPFMMHDSKPKIGVQLIELNPELGEFFGSPTKKGMLVKKVDKDSPGEKAGIKVGDVIIGIGKESVEDLHDILSALKDYKNGDTVELGVLRKGNEIKIPVEITGQDSSCCEKSNMMFFNNSDGNDIEINMEGFKEGMKMLGPQIRTMIKKFKFDSMDNDTKNIQIEIEKMKPEIEKAAKEIRIKLNGKELNLDELKTEIEKMKPEIEKMKKEIKKNVIIIRTI